MCRWSNSRSRALQAPAICKLDGRARRQHSMPHLREGAQEHHRHRLGITGGLMSLQGLRYDRRQ